MRAVIGALRLLTFFITALFTLAYQSVILTFTKGRIAYLYPRLYHAFLCRLMGIRVITEGEILHGRNVVYLGNHLSYLDIEALGGLVIGSFVAKKELATWPFFAQMANLQRTFYISRSPQDAPRETKAMLERLDEGLPLIIFPEGTSSRGENILPFKSSFFEIFLKRDIRIQPFTISLLEVDGKPASTPALRDLYAWYGDMDLEPHLWSFAKSKGAVVKITFHEPVKSLSYDNRKTLCADCYEAVVKGLDLSPPPPYRPAETTDTPITGKNYANNAR